MMKPSDFAPDEEIRRLYARLDDLAKKAASGRMGKTPFLTPREVRYASQHLSSRLVAGTAFLWGGYPDAERRKAFLLPDYMEGLVNPASFPEDPVTALSEGGFREEAEAVASAVSAVCVSGSGFGRWGHRDCLGSLLGLGVERDAIGDLRILTPSGSGLVFCESSMAGFLCENWTKIAADTVKAVRKNGKVSVPPCETEEMALVVTSARLDCIVAALCRLSREKAQDTVKAGLAEVDYDPVSDCSRMLEPPCILSVRGFGKFILHGFDGETRKGRLRLRVGRYI